MKLIHKAILPAVMTLAGLTSFEAQASTTAGTMLRNKATLSYDVAGSAQSNVEAVADVVVDVKLSFTLTATDDAVNASTLYNLNGDANAQFYLAGEFNLSNSGNTDTTFDLTSSELSGGQVSSITEDAIDNINLSNNGTYLLYQESGDSEGLDSSDIQITDGKISRDKDDTTGIKIYVVAPQAAVVGKEKDILGVILTAKAASVITKGTWTPPVDGNGAGSYATDVPRNVNDNADESNGGNAVIDFVFATASGDNSAEAQDALLLAFPSFGTDPDDENKNGFVKTAVVVYDPINETTSPKAIPGAIVKYTITLENVGSQAAQNVNLSDPIPANTEYCGTGDDLGGNGNTLGICENISAGSSDTVTATTAPAVTANNVTAGYSTFAPNGVATLIFYVKIQ